MFYILETNFSVSNYFFPISLNFYITCEIFFSSIIVIVFYNLSRMIVIVYSV